MKKDHDKALEMFQQKITTIRTSLQLKQEELENSQKSYQVIISNANGYSTISIVMS